MKIFKIRMISDMQIGIRGLEIQVPSSKSSSSKPEPKEVQAALEKAGYKPKISVSYQNFEVIG